MTWIKWISIAIIVAGLVFILKLLPVEAAVKWLSGWIDQLGVWGSVAFAGVYVLAAVLLIPAVALTIAAGAIFGLLWGTVIVSIASTVAAAVAFLIGRYLARGAVERRAKAYPKFAAIDKAIGEQGWKIIGLLRLSPAIPFSIGNYLYGTTSVAFWPYVLVSWIAMLPGTLVYVYLGYIGGAQGGGRSPGQWALLIAGLVATVAVTVYVTYLAKKAMKAKVSSSKPGDTRSNDPHEGETKMLGDGNDEKKGTSPRSALIAAACAVLVTIGAACSYIYKSTLASLAGPPAVTMKEAYQKNAAGAVFDHSPFDLVLKKHVTDGGWVNYEGVRSDLAALNQYIAQVEAAPFAELSRDEKLALLINGYNAFTLRLIVDNYPLKSIRDIPSQKRWDDKRWKIAGKTRSLSQIEHEEIRPKFKEPRVHFALVCAAIGCPILRNEAYVGARIDEQLEDQTRYIHEHDRWFQLLDDPNNSGKSMVRLTSLYDWYSGDFKQSSEGSALKFASRYSRQLDASLKSSESPKIQWIDYDWSLNSIENKAKVDGAKKPEKKQ